MTDKNKKDLKLLFIALVIPFGLTALGIWKAYEIYKEKTKEEDVNQTR